jgi:signal transduction histidine kinase
MHAAGPPPAGDAPASEVFDAAGAAEDTSTLRERLGASVGELLRRANDYARHQLDTDDPATLAGYVSGASDTLTLRRVLLSFAACAVAGIGEIFRPRSAASGAEALVLVIYLASLAALIPVHLSPNRRIALAGVAVSVVLGAVLIFTYASVLCVAIFALLAVVLVFRFPWALSLPALGVIGVLFALLLLAHGVTAGSAANPWSDVGRGVSTFALGAAFAVATRSRAQVIRRLRDTQQQLRTEMLRTAELAATRERTRIARDMHDVLAHSLTVLSIQTVMLDDIAGLLRESITESRRLVGVLRETERAGTEDSPLGVRLTALADAFAARSGTRCVVREGGQARALSSEHEHTLHFALQESLTNAYRHGAASQVVATLAWEADAVTLTVADNGRGTADVAAPGDGNGLRGMGERAAALGGSVTFGPLAPTGYRVVIALPFAHGR